MPGIDLLQFARANRLGRHVGAASEWLADLDTSKEGSDFMRHLTHDVALPHQPAANALLRSLITHIGTDWHAGSPRPAAIDWLMDVLDAQAATFLCQGKAVPDEAATDTLCRTTDLRNAYNYLSYEALGKPTRTFAAGALSPGEVDRLREWADIFLGDPAATPAGVRMDGIVRGRLPLVFASPETDRHRAWPAGTPVKRILEVLGLSIDPAAEADQCVLVFSQSAAGRGHVPTALDACTNSYFMPPRWNACWGKTLDLRSLGGKREAGVRECVVPAFEARHVARFDVIQV